MSCGLYAVGRHSGGFPALWTRKTTLSGPVCSTGSMDSDSRMGQGLGQNPGKPEGHSPSGNSLSESRERNFSPTPGKSRTRENQRSEKAHLKPAPLACMRLSQTEEGNNPCPISGLPWPVFAGVWRAEIPSTKPAEPNGLHDPFQRPDFPGKPWTTQGSEAKQEKALTLYAPGRSLPPAVRADFPGVRVTLFSPAPSPDDTFLVGNHDFPHWEGVLPDASRLFRSRK